MKSPAFTVWPSVKPTCCNVPAIWVRMVTVSNGVTVPKASLVRGMSHVMTGATRTVWGGCAGRPEVSSRLPEGAALWYFFHAENPAAARAATTTIHNRQFRRRRGAVSTVVGATGAGAARCVTSSGLSASFIANAHILRNARCVTLGTDDSSVQINLACAAPGLTPGRV